MTDGRQESPSRLLPQEFIRAKRDGRPLAPQEIADFVAGITDETVTEGQVAAFAMAVFFNGMSAEEAVALTLAMRDSGDVLSWPEIDRPVVDKHSTGGVGDNVSLMLAPIVAACGAAVPMISGRGLGHTGGTLDKMESIPGYQVMPDNARFRRTVAEVGCAVIGQTGALAPADKRFYAIRDVTATVESVPLITASILSKKLAAGLGALVLDVKCGNGAFMENRERAEELARSLVTVANGAGLPAEALITAMDQPLASAAGNAVEVQHAVDFLTGARREARMAEVTLALAARMLRMTGLAGDDEAALQAARQALESGRAAECFDAMVVSLGGPKDFVENAAGHLPRAPVVRDVAAPAPGVVEAVGTRGIGLAVVTLGGGRRRAADPVDHAVGLTDLAAIGRRIEKGDPIATVHARNEDDADAAAREVLAAYRIGAAAEGDRPAVMAHIS
jgi:thymidine phosphorylase